MGRFIVRRLFSMVLVMFVISILTFLMLVKLPGGDPADRIAGRTATQVQVQQIRHKYGFDKPVLVQYADTMSNIFTGKADDVYAARVLTWDAATKTLKVARKIEFENAYDPAMDK